MGYDGNRIILIGHSAGAHLVALISTDPRYLGDSLNAVIGTMPIDGAGYDVPKQMADSRLLAKRIYEPAFGTDPARQKALSPVTHAGERDVPHWFLLFSSKRKIPRPKTACSAMHCAPMAPKSKASAYRLAIVR